MTAIPLKTTETTAINFNFRSDDLSDPYQKDYAPQETAVLYAREENRKLNRQNHPEGHHGVDEGLEAKTCRVCGDAATGMYFGALVCVPCKTFFLRYAGDGFSYECKYSKDCEVTTVTRTQCKYCRYQKCLKVGMCRRVRPAQVEAQDGQQLCAVCQDVANGVHFGVQTCEGCKKFFRRGLSEQKSYKCRNNESCSINPSNRNSCRYCRFQKCIEVGMSREAIQMGRPSKMSIFEGVHQRPQLRDTERSAQHQKQEIHPQPLGGSSGLPSRKTLSGLDYGSDYSWHVPTDLKRANSSQVHVGDGLEKRGLTNGMFPPWMEHPLVVVPGDSGRHEWSQYGGLPQGRQRWSVGPLAGKYSPVKAASDEGERSDGSACPDSTIVREEADPFLPVDYTSLQRSLTSGDWGKDEEYLQDWTDIPESMRRDSSMISGSGFREASPSGMMRKCKLEVLSSEDEGTSAEYKRGRYDGPARGDTCILTQGTFDLADAPAKYTPEAGKHDSFSSGSHDDVTSSELVTRLGFGIPLSDAPTSGSMVPPLEDRIQSSAVLVQPLGNELSVGSPSVSSSSSIECLKVEHGEDRCSHCLTNSITVSEAMSDKDCSSERKEPGERRSSRDSAYNPRDLQVPSDEVGNQCWHTIKRVIPAYHRFVNAGTTINHQLKESYETWKKENPKSDNPNELSQWIQSTVVPAYTTASVAYCKSLPDFMDLCQSDQRTLIACGQSGSRILAAALHWYDATEKRFRNFLSWRADTPHRPDSFKGKLREFAEKITKLHLDPIEAALLNALGIFCTDNSSLRDKGAIEASCSKILTTMKSYIAANCSSSGDRLELLCKILNEAQVLGAEHVALTNTRNLGLPPANEKNETERNQRSVDGQSVSSGGQSQCAAADLTIGQQSGQSPKSPGTGGQTTSGGQEASEDKSGGQLSSNLTDLTQVR